jgi:hypothetical protein
MKTIMDLVWMLMILIDAPLKKMLMYTHKIMLFLWMRRICFQKFFPSLPCVKFVIIFRSFDNTFIFLIFVFNLYMSSFNLKRRTFFMLEIFSVGNLSMIDE